MYISACTCIYYTFYNQRIPKGSSQRRPVSGKSAHCPVIASDAKHAVHDEVRHQDRLQARGAHATPLSCLPTSETSRDGLIDTRFNLPSTRRPRGHSRFYQGSEPMRLPGHDHLESVGAYRPVHAQRVVLYRQTHGSGFTAKAELVFG
jgi:hypothetical protein